MDYSKDECVTSTDIRRRFKYCCDKAKELGRVIILYKGKPHAVLMDIEYYNKLYKPLSK